MNTLTVAVCTYNRADRLPALIQALRAQQTTADYSILFINNNSKDNTPEVLEQASQADGVPLRFVTESKQGITHARNRAITECLNSDIMMFMDDDELPAPGWVEAAYQRLKQGDVQIAGGRVKVRFDQHSRPKWLADELLGFLAEVDYGEDGFPIVDGSTPVWTADVAYDMSVFRDHPDLRYDERFNRVGDGLGGGEDRRMFDDSLALGIKMAYEPDMIVEHHVDGWKLTRSYFLKLHYEAGRKYGRFMDEPLGKHLFGVPIYMWVLPLKQAWRNLVMALTGKPGQLRQGMNLSHALGAIQGRHQQWKQHDGEH